MGRTANLSHVILSNPDNGYEPYDNSTPLPVTLSGGGSGGDASSANQVTMISHLSDIDTAVTGTLTVSDSVAQSSLSNIDSKITVCNTGAVAVSSSALPSGGATSALQSAGNADLSTIAGDTTSLDSKVTACNTGAVVISSNSDTTKATSTLQSAGNASLATLAGCENGANALQVDINADAVGLANQSLQTAGNSSLSSIDGKLPASLGQTVMNSSVSVTVASDQSAVKIQNAEVANAGSHANLANNVTINSGSFSSVVSVANMNMATILYEDTATASFDALDIEISADGTNYFAIDNLYPNLNGAGTKRVASRSNMGLHGITHLRLKNISSTDNYTGVTATIVGAP